MSFRMRQEAEAHVKRSRLCCNSLVTWGESAKLRAIAHAHQLKAMSVTGQNPLPVLSHDELYDKQCRDPRGSAESASLLTDGGACPGGRECMNPWRC